MDNRSIAGALVLLCSGSLGCGSSHYGNTYDVSIAPEVSLEMAGEVLDALQEWQHKVPDLKFNVSFGYGSGAPRSIIVRSAPVAWIQAQPELGSDVGYTERHADTDSALVILGTLSDAETITRRTMTAHELGHAMGLLHPPGAAPFTQVMCATDTCAAQHVGCADAQQWYELRDTAQPTCE